MFVHRFPVDTSSYLMKRPFLLCKTLPVSISQFIENPSQIAMFMGPTWGPPGSCPRWAPCWPHEHIRDVLNFVTSNNLVVKYYPRLRKRTLTRADCSQRGWPRMVFLSHDDVIKWKHLMMVPGEFPAQRPVTQSFDVFVDLCLNKRLSKQSWGWWFEMLSHPLWRRRNDKRHHRLKSVRYRLNDKYTKHFIRRKTNQYVYNPFVCRLSMFHDMVQPTLYSLNMNMFPMNIQNICIWIVLQAQRFIPRRINRLYKI